MYSTISPYEFGLEGALMHVYENECAYNSILKSIGVSELKYYIETGGVLFEDSKIAKDTIIKKLIIFIDTAQKKILQIFNKIAAYAIQYIPEFNDFLKVNRLILSKIENKNTIIPYNFSGLDKEINSLSAISKNEPNLIFKLLQTESESNQEIEVDMNYICNNLFGYNNIETERDLKQKVISNCYSNGKEKDTYEISKINTYTKVTYGEMIEWLTRFKDSAKDIQNANSSFNKEYNTLKKTLKTFINNAANDNQLNNYKAILTHVKDVFNATQIYIGVIIGAAVDRIRLAKTKLQKGIAGYNSNKSHNVET